MASKKMTRNIINILALNEVGALARIISVFGRRGFNIETVTASPTQNPKITRITIVITATEETMQQVLAQVEKVELVQKVYPLSENSVYRELLLIRVEAGEAERTHIMEIVDTYRGKIIDLSVDSMVIELTGSPAKISAFIEVIGANHMIAEVSRTGATGIEAAGRSLSSL